MEAMELRIGNILRGPVWVWSIQKIKDKIIINELPDFEHKPIPLTEDWLLRFGFENSKTQDKFFTKGNNIGISTADNQLRFIQGNFVCQLVLREIKYVHQLQNLYFALTGEELKLSN